QPEAMGPRAEPRVPHRAGARPQPGADLDRVRADCAVSAHPGRRAADDGGRCSTWAPPLTVITADPGAIVRVLRPRLRIGFARLIDPPPVTSTGRFPTIVHAPPQRVFAIDSVVPLPAKVTRAPRT